MSNKYTAYLIGFIQFNLCILAFSFFTGCSSMSIEYPEPVPNCVDFVIANWQETDIAHHGKYNSNPFFNHLWIERDGRCFDNMNPMHGFMCESDKYESMEIWDLNNQLKVLVMLGKRPQGLEGWDNG